MIAKQLLANGQAVRVLVRENSPSAALAEQGMATSVESLVEAGAQTVVGDLKDRESLERACEGIETVITTANAFIRGGADTFESVDLDGTKNLIDAAVSRGARHLIYTSAAGSDPDHPHPLFRAKGRCEVHLESSGLEYTILQPGVFMEIWIGAIVGIPLKSEQPVTLVEPGSRQQAFVSMADVAAYAVASVDDPNALNQKILIAGPESYSWIQAVENVGRVIGREIPVDFIAPGDPVPLVPEAVGPLLAALEMEDSFIEMGDTSARYGIEPTSLDTFAARFFG